MKEDAHAFHLHDGKSEFRVAKKGLSPSLHGRIAQHFADGGEVDAPNFVEKPTDEVPNVDPATAKSLDALFGAKPAATAADVAPSGAPAVTGDGSTTTNRGLFGGVGEAPQGPSIFDKVYGFAQKVVHPDPAAPPVAPQATTPAQDEAPPMLAKPPEQVKLPGGTVSGLGKEVAASYKGQMDATQQFADVEAQKAKAMEAQQLRAAADVQRVTDENKARWQENQGRADTLAADIASSKLDPNRYWASKSTGSKIGSIAAIVLGGLASRGQGPNGAMEVLNKAIDNDIMAQKANLQNKQSQLSFYMQKGHDIQEAGRLAKADAMDVSAGQLQALASKFAGPEQQAAAMKQVAALRGDAAKSRQGIYEDGLRTQLTALQVQQQRAAMQGAQNEKALLSALGRGVKLPPGAVAQLDPKLQNRLVSLPDGTYALARSEEQQKEVQHTQNMAQEVRQKIARYRALAEGGSPSVPGTQSHHEAEALRADILAGMGHLHDLNRLSDKDLELFEKQVPEYGLFSRNTNLGAKLDQLGKSIDEKVSGTNRSFLNMGGQEAPSKMVVR